ncbi:Blp family class II bacteriocin [Enterococcus sp. DIV1444a]|uniref:Blp family class II bacteriocin n=1 Tax=Enterococcus sp. DIV1444a TaxID=2774679 RepID=UPI003F23FA3D
MNKYKQIDEKKLQKISGGKINWGSVVGNAAGGAVIGAFGGIPGAVVGGVVGAGSAIIDGL